MNIETIIKKEKKKYKIALSITGIMSILALLSIIYGLIVEDKAQKEAKHFENHYDKKDIVLSYIEPHELSNAFMYHTDNEESYRLVEDKNGEVYIINVYESKIDEIKKYNSKVYGTVKELPWDVAIKLTTELKKVGYNIQTTDIENVYGVSYLDATDSFTDKADLFMILGVIFIFIGPIFLLVYLCLYLSFNKSIKSLTQDKIYEINKELNGNVKKFEKLQIYLTDNYLISHSRKLICYKYDEIFMIFKQRVAANRSVNYFLFVIGPNGKQEQISELHQFATKYLPDFDAVIEDVSEKNPEVLIGQDPENNRLLKEFRKELKQNKRKKITN